ncbi:unnamed protein product [Protopolystoma xenopodis]|uniref:Uncharacterized protein n=1 Tax=Protopolystoma xenopodis TaxID=117903 RepID=A0A448WW97_9PLAT|nr:unnamed protein product [Protopolystoma xenopodis]
MGLAYFLYDVYFGTREGIALSVYVNSAKTLQRTLLWHLKFAQIGSVLVPPGLVSHKLAPLGTSSPRVTELGIFHFALSTCRLTDVIGQKLALSEPHSWFEPRSSPGGETRAEPLPST